jgi:radical SAM protein with 4Fe4S-binding SPASM domain
VPLESVQNSNQKPSHQFVLQWHITEKCNLRCQHCYQESSAVPDLTFDTLLSILEQFKELLKKLRSETVDHTIRAQINVTGGEPFVRRDFLDLLEVFDANKEFFSFGILTNGTLIDESMASRLAILRPKYVQVSLEGSPSTNDAIRGDGAFDDTVSALKLLIGEGISTAISFTAHKDNFREFPEVARIGRQLGVARVWSDRLIPCGSGSDLIDGSLAPEEAREFFGIMYGERRRMERTFCRTKVSMNRALQFLVGGERPYRCHAGENLITVMPNGDLYPCRRLPIKVGNLTERHLTDLYYSSDLFEALRTHRTSEGCEECRFTTECRGGLRCLSYAITGDPFHPDPGCWRVKGEADGRAVAPVFSGPNGQASNMGA